MNNSPKITIRKKREDSISNKDFNFTRDNIRLSNNSYIKDYRENAWQSFSNLPLPTTKQKNWGRTDLQQFPADQFRISDSIKLTLSTNPEYDNSQGIIFTDLQTAERDHPDLVEKVMGKIIKPDEGKFTSLAGALSQNGVFLYVPKGIHCPIPFSSKLLITEHKSTLITHNLIFLEEGASATFTHETVSSDDSIDSLHTSLFEIYVGADANLSFIELQASGKGTWNFSNERANIDSNGKIDWIFGATGSCLSKSFLEINLIGEGSNARLGGIYFPNQSQHMDFDTKQNHFSRNTTSDLLFKGAMLDKSHSIWQGMIYIAPGAQNTDGYQANNNLMLSPNSRVDCIPGLEILADDVHCSHGSTTGEIDEDQLFYLLCRGIEKKEAEKLIVKGFFSPVIDRIPDDTIKQRFLDEIEEKLST